MRALVDVLQDTPAYSLACYACVWLVSLNEGLRHGHMKCHCGSEFSSHDVFQYRICEPVGLQPAENSNALSKSGGRPAEELNGSKCPRGVSRGGIVIVPPAHRDLDWSPDPEYPSLLQHIQSTAQHYTLNL